MWDLRALQALLFLGGHELGQCAAPADRRSGDTHHCMDPEWRLRQSFMA